MSEYLSPPSLERRKKRFLTKSVHPPWYIRYAHVLPESEMCYLQPIREIKEEQAMINALKTPPKEKDKTEELVRKLEEEKKLKIETVLFLIEGDSKNLKEKIANIKPLTSPLKYNLEQEKAAKAKAIGKGGKAFHGLVNEVANIDLFPNSKWKKLRENKVIRTKLNTLIKECRIARITHHWQRAIRNVRAVNRFARVIAKIARTTSEVFKKFKKLTEKAYKDETGLFFDKSYYKTTSTGRALDRNTIFTLSKPERYRTWEEAHKAAINLRFLKSFSAFPVQHQDKIAMIGWFAKIPPDKVIIRQGHVADSFYFVMYGKAVAVQLDGCPEHELHSGFTVLRHFGSHDLIGEEGISDRELRTYTVSTVETTGLLCVNIDDYHRIFATSMTEDENPDHIRFLSQLDFMRYFPINVLIENHEGNVIVYYYRKETVVTKKTSASNYFYIIKAGTCAVMAEVVVPVVRDKFKCMKYVLPPIPEVQYTDTEADNEDLNKTNNGSKIKIKTDGVSKISKKGSKGSQDQGQDLESETNIAGITNPISRIPSIKNSSLGRLSDQLYRDKDGGAKTSGSALSKFREYKQMQQDQSSNAKSDCEREYKLNNRANARSDVISVRGGNSRSFTTAKNSKTNTGISRARSSQPNNSSLSRRTETGRRRSSCDTSRNLESSRSSSGFSTDFSSASKNSLTHKHVGLADVSRNRSLTGAHSSGQRLGIPGVNASAKGIDAKVTTDSAGVNRNMSHGKSRKKKQKERDPEDEVFVVKKRGDSSTITTDSDTLFTCDDDEDFDSEEDECTGEESKAISEMERFTSMWKSNTIAYSIRKSGYHHQGSRGDSIEVVRPLQKAGSVEKVLVNKNKNKRTDLESSWVCLRTLSEADVFGIEDLDLGDPYDSKRMEVSIVSEGAEVILFSKKFFLDNASAKMRAHLRASSFIMPDEDSVSLELQKLRYWNRFKEKTVTSIYKEMGIRLDLDN